MKPLNWGARSNEEKKKAQGFVRLAEYDAFYLYAKVDKNNNVMYRECFSKFDIDGATRAQEQPNKMRRVRHGKTMLG